MTILLVFELNKRTRNAAVSPDDLGSWFANSTEGSTWFDGDEAQIKLRNAIIKLPEKQRIVFNLKYYDEMTYEEMSKVLALAIFHRASLQGKHYRRFMTEWFS